MKYKTLLTELHHYQIKKITDLIITWCISKFGTRKYCPNVSVVNVKDRKEPDYAWYEPDRHTPEITINITPTSNVQNLVDSLLHEYTHYLEPNFQQRYEEYEKKYDYDHHPLEKKARKVAKKHRRKCFNDIKKEL